MHPSAAAKCLWFLDVCNPSFPQALCLILPQALREWLGFDLYHLLIDLPDFVSSGRIYGTDRLILVSGDSSVPTGSISNTLKSEYPVSIRGKCSKMFQLFLWTFLKWTAKILYSAI